MPFELECVHAPSRQITFLDTTITVDLSRRKIITNIYDKRSGMACYKNARTFPHRDSLLVDAQKYGVVTSQFIRYGRRISCMSDYLTATSDLAARMIVHGYDASLYQNIKRFAPCPLPTRKNVKRNILTRRETPLTHA